MIVAKPIGSVKIGRQSHRLTVGRPVPIIVLEFWKSTKQFDPLVKAGAIVEKSDFEKAKAEKEKANKDRIEKRKVDLEKAKADKKKTEPGNFGPTQK